MASTFMQGMGGFIMIFDVDIFRGIFVSRNIGVVGIV